MSIQVGDVVLVRNKGLHRNEWPIGHVTKVYPSMDDKIRKVDVVLVRNGFLRTFNRPIRELIWLLKD